MKAPSRTFFPLLLFLAGFWYTSAANSSHVGPFDERLLDEIGYSVNESANVVAGNGLEWLRWEETWQMSISQAIDSYGADGWRLASNAEMASLFADFGLDNGFGIEPNPFDSDENTTQEELAVGGNHIEFMEIFGVTGGSYMGGPLDSGQYELQWTVVSRAIFGNDNDGDGFYNLASVNYYRWLSALSLGRIGYTDWVTSIYADDRLGLTVDDSNEIAGVALVRDVAPIPIPGALPLFASAMVVFGWFYRRKKQS